ncbi:MAG: DUF2752 domain-containing protein [Flavobacteriaceae bacterium]|nr:DUF2752 domain-containing protein [Flavobacteriaceae bacterium]
MAAFRNKFVIIFAVLVFLGMLVLYFLFNPAETILFPKCPFYASTNFYCPGCGSQRAVHHILNGNIFSGLRHNYLIILLFLVLFYEAYIFISNSLLKKKMPNLLHKSKVTYSILIVIISFWILRNINIFPFTELAP